MAQSVRWVVKPARSDGERSARLLTNAAFAANAAWSANTVYRGIGWSGLAIILAGTASANGALAAAGREDGTGGRWAATTVAPLAGWLTLAFFVNLDQAISAKWGKPAQAGADRRSAVFTLGAAASVGALGVANGAPLPFVAAAGWGLATLGVQSARSGNRLTAGAAGLGLVAVAAATIYARARKDRSRD